MRAFSASTELQSALTLMREDGQSIAFVPTMGALHVGHLSLIETARLEADAVIVSIFVNPTQFAPHEDFGSYPRDETKDLDMLRQSNVDLVFLPTSKEIYPDGFGSHFSPGASAAGLESDFRPHFFGGVVNVVSRLFQIVRPDVAVFGEKDYQQLQVISEMVDTYNLSLRVVGSATVRDEYGLALSSRNSYLSPNELIVARQLNRVLVEAADAIRSGDSADELCAEAKKNLLSRGFDRVDYVKVRWGRILAAAWVGRTRLIDNMSCL